MRNIYDNSEFFAAYAEMGRSKDGPVSYTHLDGIEKRSAHIDDCLNQIHDTVENQRSNQNGRTDRKREDALR